MSRLLYILICIDLCFCYNFIDNYNKYVKKHLGNNNRNRERHREGKVVFDVAEFMRTEKSLYSDPENKNDEFGLIQSNYDYTGLINDITGNIDNAYLNEKDNEMNKNLKDLLSLEETDKDFDSELDDVSSGYKNDVLPKENLRNSEKKKCAFKSMKVPFFSHSTSTPKSRKAKKKKFVCFNCNKNDKNEPSSSYAPSTSEKPKRLSFYKHQQDLFKKILGRKKAKEKVIHNCRQFYQNKDKIAGSSSATNELTKTTRECTSQNDKTTIDYNGEIIQENGNSESPNRIKRDEKEDRERRLKILDELERKVDNTQIATPVLNNSPMPTDATQEDILI